MRSLAKESSSQLGLGERHKHGSGSVTIKEYLLTSICLLQIYYRQLT